MEGNNMNFDECIKYTRECSDDAFIEIAMSVNEEAEVDIRTGINTMGMHMYRESVVVYLTALNIDIDPDSKDDLNECLDMITEIQSDYGT